MDVFLQRIRIRRTWNLGASGTLPDISAPSSSILGDDWVTSCRNDKKRWIIGIAAAILLGIIVGVVSQYKLYSVQKEDPTSLPLVSDIDFVPNSTTPIVWSNSLPINSIDTPSYDYILVEEILERVEDDKIVLFTTESVFISESDDGLQNNISTNTDATIDFRSDINALYDGNEDLLVNNINVFPNPDLQSDYAVIISKDKLDTIKSLTGNSGDAFIDTYEEQKMGNLEKNAKNRFDPTSTYEHHFYVPASKEDGISKVSNENDSNIIFSNSSHLPKTSSSTEGISIDATTLDTSRQHIENSQPVYDTHVYLHNFVDHTSNKTDSFEEYNVEEFLEEDEEIENNSLKFLNDFNKDSYQFHPEKNVLNIFVDNSSEAILNNMEEFTQIKDTSKSLEDADVFILDNVEEDTKYVVPNAPVLITDHTELLLLPENIELPLRFDINKTFKKTEKETIIKSGHTEKTVQNESNSDVVNKKYEEIVIKSSMGSEVADKNKDQMTQDVSTLIDDLSFDQLHIDLHSVPVDFMRVHDPEANLAGHQKLQFSGEPVPLIPPFYEAPESQSDEIRIKSTALTTEPTNFTHTTEMPISTYRPSYRPITPATFFASDPPLDHPISHIFFETFHDSEHTVGKQPISHSIQLHHPRQPYFRRHRHRYNGALQRPSNSYKIVTNNSPVPHQTTLPTEVTDIPSKPTLTPINYNFQMPRFPDFKKIHPSQLSPIPKPPPPQYTRHYRQPSVSYLPFQHDISQELIPKFVDPFQEANYGSRAPSSMASVRASRRQEVPGTEFIRSQRLQVPRHVADLLRSAPSWVSQLEPQKR